MKRICTVALAAALVLGACTSGDDDEPVAADDEVTSTSAAPTGPAPGVTDDAIKVGVTFVDTTALKAVGLDYDLGDHRAVYEALAADINADGGINGRRLELVMAPVDPTSTNPGEAACVQLTEDEDVFVVTGFYLADGVLCPVELHATAVVGGNMNPNRLERAEAPWLSPQPDTDQPAAVVAAYAEQGELAGRVGVFAASAEVDNLEDIVLPALAEAGIEPVETGIMDAPVDDSAAIDARVQVIAQRFQAADVDTVVFVGANGANWLSSMADDASYRPKLRFLDINGSRAFATSAATADTSILVGSLSGGTYGPDQARYEDAGMQACLAVLAEAGIETPAPKDVGDEPGNQPYQAAFQACPDMALLRAWLEAAGDDLHYGTLEGAADGLSLALPGDPGRRTYGPGTAGDGNPKAYLYGWDEATRGFVLDEG